MRTGDVRELQNRALVLTSAYQGLVGGITGFSITTAVDDTTTNRGWHLLIDLNLSEGPVAKLADLLFHGSKDAHQLNGEILLDYGIRGLDGGIQRFVDGVNHSDHLAKKLSSMRGKKRFKR